MPKLYNVYCDESCHLEHDGHPIMALGAIWCPKEAVKTLSSEIAELKRQHGAEGELKWGKVSPAKMGFYEALIAWFVEKNDIKFRGLVVLDKSRLNHESFNNGSHDTFYYKMYFSLLREILSPDRQYEIYLDIKDTRSRRKIAKLREVLCYDKYDFTSEMIVNLQNIRSHESQLIQIADFLVGAVSYKHRYIVRAQSAPISQAKSRLITIIEHSIKADLGKSTSRHADKINLFCFTPRQVHQ